MNFATIKQEFDKKYNSIKEYECILPEHLTFNKIVSFKKKDGTNNEQYYKWQFLYSIINSGMYIKDYIGTEINFPKGNKNSAQIKIDACIFDSNEWFEYYTKYHNDNDMDALDWLRKHLIVVIEFKKEDSKDITTVWEKQLKAYLKESEREFCLGIIYDTERLYLFRKNNNKFLRYSDEFNTQNEESTTKDLALHLPDPYINLPDFDNLINWVTGKTINRSKRTIHELDIISSIHSTQINNSMSSILKTMDKQGMVNQKGYEILLQIIALKIFDEKRNENNNSKFLEFYIEDSEKNYSSIGDEKLQKFIQRITKIKENAKGIYYRILKEDTFNVKNENHIKIIIEIITQFQDYSFVRSTKTDLYQLVFYKFASQFSKDQNAQFITPLPLIEFLVSIINPRNGETVIDPTVGIADFLSVAYVNSKSKLDDNNIYGFDIDEDMVKLATLNMLLNGDGNAKIKAKPGYGSIQTKFGIDGALINLDPNINKNGDWDTRYDENQLMKFDVVLTNPPFGEDRAFEPKDDKDKAIIECYELWNKYGGKKIDLGVVFLENAYRILKDNGRLGIVLSNSIASIDTHKPVREWIIENMRLVAMFDLPSNVFAETGVNTTIIVAYKAEKEELEKLKKGKGYSVFFRSIEKVGYEVKTKKRVNYFEKLYRIDNETFEMEINEDGSAKLLEDFTDTIKDFKKWCRGQEETLQNLFIKER